MTVHTLTSGTQVEAEAGSSPESVGGFSILAPAGSTVHANSSLIFQNLEDLVKLQLTSRRKGVVGQLKALQQDRASNVLLQYSVKPGDTFDFSLVKHDANFQPSNQARTKLATLGESISGPAFSAELQTLGDKFDAKLADKLPAGTDEAQLAFASYSLSALVGGIGYFSGSSLERDDGGEAREGPLVSLFSGVPCRPFFPRGFLWDEGFHQLVGGWWSPAVRRDVLAHWMGVSRADGWIPREQILGVEAITRVPREFVTQTRDQANPPSLMLVVDKMIRDKDPEDMALLRELFPALRQWFNWFETTQRGHSKGDGYMWRGRSVSDGKLNAMTLSSGLDDYPRASNPSEDERHVDLLCWVANTAAVLSRLATELGEEAAAAEYSAHAQRLAALVVPLHWNAATKAFNDVGLHSNNGKFEKQIVIQCENMQGAGIQATAPNRQNSDPRQHCPQSHPNFKWPLGDGHGGLLQREVFVPIKKVKVQMVEHFGYVSLFPMMLRVLPAESEELGAVLRALRDPAQLWTPWGLRSISKKSNYYRRENAPGDAPYWRGPIWINLQLLALHGLHHYARTPGPSQELASEIYKELRSNVLGNLQKEWERTGFLWEQYSEKDGTGQRARPFNGWSSLAVSIMAEDF